MKKLSLLLMVAFAINGIQAQSLDEIKKLSILGKSKDMLVAVDKYLAVEKNAKKPDGWYYKAYALALIAKDSGKAFTASHEDRTNGFIALKKYAEMDPKLKLSAEENNVLFFDFYAGFQDLGVKEYGQKNFLEAHNNFKSTLEVHDYTASHGIAGANDFKFSALDTLITLYAAITANEAKLPDTAAVYYAKIVEANVSDQQYIDAYQFLSEYYKKKGDKPGFAALLEKAKKFYPSNSEYWTAMEIEEATEGVAKPALFDQYEILLKKYPTNYVIAFNYSVELYRYIYSDEMKTANTDTYKAKLQEILKKAISINSTSEANFLMANFLYNNSIDIAEIARKIKGPKPEDLKRKRAMEADANKVMEEAIPYAEKVIELFPSIAKPKGGEKVNNRQAITILKNIYETKKDAAKVALYDKKLKELE